MATVIYNCKRCKRGRRVDYPLGNSKQGFYRVDAAGNRIPSAVWIAARVRGFIEYGGDTEHGICPSCFRAMDYGQLKAYLKPEHKCDARCTGARGPNCECSCGGANHGIAA